jgi:cyclopropane fatty-acyl-phospholipid synthase-like methyltransferase
MSFRSRLYDFWLGNFGITTPELYQKFLESLPDNTRVLDVGVGNGICIEKCSQIIKSESLQIDGIDIDDEYIQACQERITRCGLSDQVRVFKQDLLTFIPENKYDIVIFMESYPVIPEDLMSKFVLHAKAHLSSNIVFIHNLVQEKTLFRTIFKPLLVYTPLIWVDFGRLVSHSDFDKFASTIGLTYTKKCLAKRNVFFMDIKQYQMTCS